MKRKLLTYLIFVVLPYNLLFGQVVPNAGFENWTSNGAYEEPNSWATSNVLSAFGAPPDVIKTTDKHSGNYAMKLSVLTYTDANTSTVDTTVGLAKLSDNIFTDVGVPFSGRPDKLSCYYKYNRIAAVDSGVLGGFLYRWDPVNKARELVAVVELDFKSIVNTYTYASADLQYYSTEMPDTLVLYAAASYSDYLQAGSTLWLDDLAFEGGISGIKDVQGISGISVFPNPCHDRCSFSIPSELIHADVTLKIYDVLGQEVRSLQDFQQQQVFISREGLPAGLYLYRFYSKDKLLESGKLLVE